MRLGLSKSLEIPGERSVGLGPRPLWKEYGLGSLDGGPCRTVSEYSEVESHRAGLKRTGRKTTELKLRAQLALAKWDLREEASYSWDSAQLGLGNSEEGFCLAALVLSRGVVMLGWAYENKPGPGITC